MLAILSIKPAVVALSTLESSKTVLYNPVKVLRKVSSIISWFKSLLDTYSKVCVAICLKPEDGGPKSVTIMLQEIGRLVSDSSIADE